LNVLTSLSRRAEVKSIIRAAATKNVLNCMLIRLEDFVFDEEEMCDQRLE
jgi:hypothetical protein